MLNRRVVVTQERTSMLFNVDDPVIGERRLLITRWLTVTQSKLNVTCHASSMDARVSLAEQE
jgi:hypothetical protein